jgi:hypothetical protein
MLYLYQEIESNGKIGTCGAPRQIPLPIPLPPAISGPEIPLPASSPDDTQGVDKQQILDIK